MKKKRKLEQVISVLMSVINRTNQFQLWWLWFVY